MNPERLHGNAAFENPLDASNDPTVPDCQAVTPR